MSIDERHRIALHEAARDTWGPEIAGTLMEMLPPGGWAEVATKSDVAAVKSDLAANVASLKSDIAGVRSDLAVLKAETATKSELAVFGAELRTEMADLRATLERGLRTNLMWTVTTMVALVAVVTAISGFTR